MFSLSLSLVLIWCRTVEGEVTWPSGQYGLPMPRAGCPNNWFEGRRFSDTESGQTIDTKVYQSLNLAGRINKEGIEQDFCIKTNKDKAPNWPAGRYCILKSHEVCPAGLTNGSVQWHRSSSKFQDSSINGKQLKDTKVEYCCSARGDIKKAIVLPLKKPFYMYAFSSDGCQAVHGATVKEESITFEKNEAKYHIDMEGQTPFTVDNTKAQMTATYCYYTPGGTIAIPESQEVEKTLFTGTELDNKTQSSGLAVAIGVGIACAMVGTASIALVTRKLMKKKKEEEDDDPRPDDP